MKKILILGMIASSLFMVAGCANNSSNLINNGTIIDYSQYKTVDDLLNDGYELGSNTYNDYTKKWYGNFIKDKITYVVAADYSICGFEFEYYDTAIDLMNPPSPTSGLLNDFYRCGIEPMFVAGVDKEIKKFTICNFAIGEDETVFGKEENSQSNSIKDKKYLQYINYNLSFLNSYRGKYLNDLDEKFNYIGVTDEAAYYSDGNSYIKVIPNEKISFDDFDNLDYKNKYSVKYIRFLELSKKIR